MNWHGQANGKRGRSPSFSDEAIQFCLSIKCLFSLPLRQAMGMAQSLLGLAGLDWPVPDYSTVSRRQKTLRVAIEVVPTTTGLHLLVDSTGIKMLSEGEWKTKRMALITAANGARSISVLMLPRLRYGPWK